MSKAEAHLLIDNWFTTCSNCGQQVLPNAKCHIDVSGYNPFKGGGCGAVFVGVRSTVGDRVGAQRVRPDLPYCETEGAEMSPRVFVEVPDDDRTIEGVGVWQSWDGKGWATLLQLDREAAVERMMAVKLLLFEGSRASVRLGRDDADLLLAAALGEDRR